MTGTSTEVAQVAQQLRDGTAGGALSFPLASFRGDGSLGLDAYLVYLAGRLATAPGAVFPACGTGEFFSLDEDEYRAVVQAAVELADGRTPVVAGIGYGWAQAVRFARFARIAEDAGADAALVLPHHLVSAPQDGLVEQLRRIAGGTRAAHRLPARTGRLHGSLLAACRGRAWSANASSPTRRCPASAGRCSWR
jgi:5-dehydro-4-deoxyglucarate dehydratase